MFIDKTWFTSDTHFYHKNVIEYCKRPFSDIDSMNHALIQNWNAAVKPDHTVFVLGDFSFGNKEQTQGILRQLNGRKILIWGNHDQDKRHKNLEMGFDLVMEQAVLRLSRNWRVKLCHFPHRASWLQRWWYGFDDRKPNLRPPKEEGMYLLHGHVHTAWKSRSRMINVGVDVWSYKPVSAVDILGLIQQLEKDS